MRFKGNIIITDPCYICKEKKEVGEYPKAKDYFSHSREKYYPDYRKMDENEIKALEEDTGFPEQFLLYEWTHKSDQYEEEKQKYDAALQEYRKNNVSDWKLCNYGEDMEVLGIENYICRDLFDNLKLSSFFSGIGAFEIALDRLYKDINSGNFINPQTE